LVLRTISTLGFAHNAFGAPNSIGLGSFKLAEIR
jgi:hypothetical protein